MTRQEMKFHQHVPGGYRMKLATASCWADMAGTIWKLDYDRLIMRMIEYSFSSGMMQYQVAWNATYYPIGWLR